MSRSRVTRLTERLTYWTEPHPDWRPNPEWPEEVGCVLFRAADALVMIDPLIRHDLDPEAWSWLDQVVSGANAPVTVLLTAPWHMRSTREVADRYGARVWSDPFARARISDLPELGAVPAGIDIFKPRGVDEGQVAFFISSEHALVVAEFFRGTAAGLRVCPSPATSDMSEFMVSLAELARWPIERVLVGHGPPVQERGAAAIFAALQIPHGT